jgi:hypothetical protein
MSLQDDINLLLTCAPVNCPREEACFRAARYLRDNMMDRVIREINELLDDDEIADYAPCWESRKRFVPSSSFDE